MALSVADNQSALTGDPEAILRQAFQVAIIAAFGDNHANCDPLISPSKNPDFGDYQANVAMSLGKQLGQPPRDVATKIIEIADLGAIADEPTIAGPGFINIRLKRNALAAMLEQIDGDTLGVEPSTDPHPVAVDLCGVNVSKQMHVGHLRSTIIGDAVARAFERRGRTVHRENHLGDWGLPIAMVLHQLRDQGVDLNAIDLTALDAAYRDAQLNAKSDVKGLAAAMAHGAGAHRIIELEEQNAGGHAALEAAKTTLVNLQQGDADLHRDWQRLIDVTLDALYDAINTMNVKLGPDNNRGESFYRDRLANVIDTFEKQNIAEEDAGALIVRFADRKRPMLIRKSDGGYLYATTDLAAIAYRTQELGATRVVYVVDARQRDHFKDLFDAAAMVGWDRTPDGAPVEFTHLAFGSVLGDDKRPLKTRGGQNITLAELLGEAVQRGTAEVITRAADPNAPTHGLSDDELAEIGRAVGIGAVKYADLSNDLVRDYVFNFDRMITFEGNTGPYLQYAHARICSILARADASYADAPITIEADAEKNLALALLRYGPTVTDLCRTLEPHRLCGYLYDLANAYSTFYQQCPVLKAPDDATMHSRLRLCDLTRRILADGLGLLGIIAPTRM